MIDDVRHCSKSMERRTFLASAAGIASVGAAATVSRRDAGAATLRRAGSAARRRFAGTGNADVDTVNFLLNIAYLEAEFFLRATTGSGLAAGSVSGSGYQGSVNGGTAVPFATSLTKSVAIDIATDLQAHVASLRALVSHASLQPVAETDIDLVNSFNILGLILAGRNFNPFQGEAQFLLGAFYLLDTAAAVYDGLIGTTSDSGISLGLLAIGASRAYHAGSVRFLASLADLSQATNVVAQFRSSLSGVPDIGTLVSANAYAIADAPTSGLTQSLTPRQALNVYSLAVNASSGGFFPSGCNGTVPA